MTKDTENKKFTNTKQSSIEAEIEPKIVEKDETKEKSNEASETNKAKEATNKIDENKGINEAKDTGLTTSAAENSENEIVVNSEIAETTSENNSEQVNQVESGENEATTGVTDSVNHSANASEEAEKTIGYPFSYITNQNRVMLSFSNLTVNLSYHYVTNEFYFPTNKIQLNQQIPLKIEAGLLLPLRTSSHTIEPESEKAQAKQQQKWRIIAVALLIIGIGGLSANTIYGKYMAYQIDAKIEKAEIKPVEIKKDAKTADSSAATSESEAPYEPLETFLDDADDEIYLGKISIPDVNLNLPIVKGVGEKNLYRGAATNKIGQQMGKGNYPMASHKVPGNDDSLFGPLFSTTKGMKIYLTDNQKIYVYEIKESYIVDPARVDILEDVPGKTLLTLYTCSTDAGVERLVVQAELVKEVKLINATSDEQAIFAAK